MKVGIDCREFYDGKMTGIGRYLKNFILGVNDLKHDFQFLLFGNQHTVIPFELPGNFRFIRINEAFTSVWDQLSLPLALKRGKADIFFSPYCKRPLFAGIPCVVTVPDLIPLIYPKNLFEKYFLKRLMKCYLKDAYVITISENSLKDIKEILRIDGGRITVVRDCVYFPVGKGTKLQDVSLPGGKYLLYVGNSNPHKNLDRLVAAYAALPEKLRAEYSLVLAGVRRYLNPRPEVPGIVIIDYVKDEILGSLYSNASLFVFPSLYEGFGLPPVEAMSFGCPVLSSNASSMPEVLGSAAEYFDPEDAPGLAKKIECLLRDGNKLKELSQKGIERARLYSAGKACRGITDVFKSIWCSDR